MKKPFKILLIAISCIGILLLIVQLISSLILPDYIKQKLEEEVAFASRGEYQLQIEKVTTNIFQFSVGIHHAELNYNSDKANDTSFFSQTRWKANIEQIGLSGINAISFLINKDIRINKISLNGSQIQMIVPSANKLKKDSSAHARNNKKDIFKNFNSIKIGSLNTSNIAFAILKRPGDTIPSFETKNLSVAMKEVKFDSSTHIFSRHQLFDAENASATIRDIKYITPDSLFALSIPQISFSYADYSIHIDSFHFTPRYKQTEFMKKVPVEKDYLDIFINTIDFKNADIKRLMEKEECVAGKMIIDSMTVHSYRDKNLSDNKKVKPLPQELLYRSPFLISIDSVLLECANVKYKERTCDADESGSVWFNNIKATVIHVTNDSVNHRQDTLSVHATGLLMGVGETEIDFHFPLFQPSGSFFGKGRIGEMEMKSFNPMLEKNAFISVKSGNIKQVRFQMRANKYESHGTIFFSYNNLEIAKLDREEKSEKNLSAKIISAVANFLLKKENPDGGPEAKTADMYWRRDPARSVFNYVWKTLFSGIKETLGAPAGKKTTIGTTTCP